MQSSSNVGDIQAITGCDEETTRRALQKYNDDPQQAINAILDGEIFAYDLIGPAQHQHNTTSASPNYQPEPSDWTGLQPLSDAGGSQRFRPPSPSNQAAQVPAGSSSDNPIDFTSTNGEEDEELRKAIAASLEQNAAPRSIFDNAAGSGEDDDAAMHQAIMDSMNSHQQRSMTTSPYAIGYSGPPARRLDNSPVALFSPLPVMSSVAAVLQLLLASPVACRAILSVRPTDSRVSQGLSDYSKGSSPGEGRATPLGQAPESSHYTKAHSETARRTQTLCAFATLSNHALCSIGDVAASVPPAVLRKASLDESRAEIASSYYSYVVEAVAQASRVYDGHQTEVNADSSTSRLTADDINRTFQSLGTTQPPVAERAAPEQHCVESQPAVELSLKPDAISSTVTAALEASLGAKQALISRPSRLLAFSVRPSRQNTNDTTPFVPFQVEPTIYLDRFVWHRRCGIDTERSKAIEDDEHQVQEKQRRVEELAQRHKALTLSEGAPVLKLIEQSVVFLRDLTKPAVDDIQDSERREAIERLEALLEATTEEIAVITAQLDREKELLSTLKRRVQEGKAQAFEGDEWRKMPYRLRGVLMSHGSDSWVYLRTDAQDESQSQSFTQRWWRVEGAQVAEVSGGVVLNDRRGDGDQEGAYFLLYERGATEDVSGIATFGGSEGPLIDFVPTNLREQIEQDNELLDSTLLSLADSDRQDAQISSHGEAIQETKDADGDFAMQSLL